MLGRKASMRLPCLSLFRSCSGARGARAEGLSLSLSASLPPSLSLSLPLSLSLSLSLSRSLSRSLPLVRKASEPRGVAWRCLYMSFQKDWWAWH